MVDEVGQLLQGGALCVPDKVAGRCAPEGQPCAGIQAEQNSQTESRVESVACAGALSWFLTIGSRNARAAIGFRCYGPFDSMNHHFGNANSTAQGLLREGERQRGFHQLRGA